MNIKALLAAMLTAIVAQPLAVQAEDINAIKHALRRLDHHGVRILYEGCYYSPIYGSYNYRTGTMTICHSAVNHRRVIETIAHETIHVAQDCLAGSIGDGRMRPIYAWLIASGHHATAQKFRDSTLSTLVRTKKINGVHNATNTNALSNEEKVAEYEAYAYEGDLFGALQYLDAACS